VQVGGILNGLVHGNDATDITDTAATTRLRQMSDEIILELYNVSKLTNVVNPWDAMSLNLSISKIHNQYRWIIKKIQKDLGYSKLEITKADLPGANTRVY
jgi:hypothetical protein